MLLNSLRPGHVGGYFLGLLAGGMAVVGWAPLAWWPMLLISYGGLFCLVGASARPSTAGLAGLCFGIGLHVTGHGWFYATLTDHVAMGGLTAALVSALILAGLALFTALPCMLYAIVCKGMSGRRPLRFVRASLFAGLMTLGEITRALVFERVSSLSVGYGLIDTWWAGAAPVVGCYGLSWLGFWMASYLACALVLFPGSAWARLLRASSIVMLALCGLAMQQHRWTTPDTKPWTFQLVQPNIAQDDKFDPALKNRITEQVVELLTATPADVVIAPETAFPMYWHELPSGVLSTLQNSADLTASHLIFGIATTSNRSDGHNSMMHLEPGGHAATQYDKRHLFPFGEYTPLGLAWMTDGMSIPLKDLSRGAAIQEPFRVMKGQHALWIGVLICHENMLSDDARGWAPHVNLLINPSNLAWFDGSWAIPQSLQITRMRALEVGRPILRVANTGETAWISASGAIVQQLPKREVASMSGQVIGETGLTPYARFGDWPVWVVCLTGIALAVVSNFRRGHGTEFSAG